MNCEVFNLNELGVEHFQIREVLRCYSVMLFHDSSTTCNFESAFSDTQTVSRLSIPGILHTIAFHRALGLVRPKDVDSELFEITYVQCGDLELEKKIEEKIDQFVSWVEKHPNKKSQMCLSFYEVRNKPAAWFTTKVERFYWEQWYISINVISPKTSGSKSHHGKASIVDSGDTMMEERNPRHAALELALRDVLFQIIRLVNEKKDHIPPVSNPAVISFPYEITIPSTSDSSFGMDMFKRMLQTGHPGMLS